MLPKRTVLVVAMLQCALALPLAAADRPPWLSSPAAVPGFDAGGAPHGQRNVSFSAANPAADANRPSLWPEPSRSVRAEGRPSVTFTPAVDVPYPSRLPEVPTGLRPAGPAAVTFSAGRAVTQEPQPQRPATALDRYGRPAVSFTAPGDVPLENAAPPRQPFSGQLGITFSAPEDAQHGVNWALLQLSDEEPPALGGEGSEGGDTSVADDQTLGEAPEETDTSIQFLRQDTILLDPGEYQFDVTLQYLTDETDFALAQLQGNILQIAEARRRQRLLLLPIEFRLGITPVTQLFINVPFGWSNSEFAFSTQDDFSNSGGIGDVSAGITRQLVEGDDSFPDVLGTLTFSAPTGKSDFATSLSTPGSALGEGFWSITSALTFIQTFDPIVVFYGFGYRHRFESAFNTGLGQTAVVVDPGKQAFYRFGAGFAVNPRVTFSTSFLGSYISEDQVDGLGVAGGSREPIQVRIAATVVRKPKHKTKKSNRVKTVEPFVNLGLTEGAIDTLFGVSWTN